MLAGAIIAFVVHFSGPTAPGPKRFVSPHGSNRAAGSMRHPWRTLARALRAARPGETIVLPSGTWGGRGRTLTWSRSGTAKHPITIVGRGRRRPVIEGYNRITGSHIIIRNIRFRGPTGPVDARTSDNPGGEDVLVWMIGSHITIRHSEISGSRWHAGVYVDGGSGNALIDDYIRDNGDFRNPAQSNLDQGVYWASGTGGLIAGCVISHNLANGIQLYPDADGVTVEHNTIVANGKSGVIVGGDSNENTIVNNIVYGNGQSSIRAFDLSGSNDVVLNNLVWRNAVGLGVEADGLTLVNNLRGSPQFAGPHDFRLRRGSMAIGRAVQPGQGSWLVRAHAASIRSSNRNVGAYRGSGVR